jgi:glutathione S-transferase
MLEIYHGASSVCSSKVRVGLVEKGIGWTGHMVNLAKGEQNDPAYLKLNPNGVVPTLVDDDVVVVESSVILEYIDDLSGENRLMSSDRAGKAAARVWLARCIDIYAAINTMTFSTVMRQRKLATATPGEIETSISKMTNPATASKRRDVLDNGLDSVHVQEAFFTLRRMFDDIQKAMENGNWLLGEDYSIADTAIISYVDRLDRLGFSGLWETQTPAVGRWFVASKERPSYRAIADFIDETDAKAMRQEGTKLWPDVKRRWEKFLGAPAQPPAV